MHRINTEQSVFVFEKNFAATEMHEWMANNWHFSIYASIVYLILVQVGQSMMHHRKPFDLQRPLLFWNLILALFSIAGSYRMVPELLHILRTYGFKESACDISFMIENNATKFWTWAFIASKVYELGDTMFLILRKRPVTVLHCVHHALTLICTSYSYAHKFAAGRFVAVLNYFVHAIMYTYFVCKSLSIYIPRWMAMSLTSLQILQFLIGIAAACRVLMALLYYHEPCSSTFTNAIICVSAYSLNVYMFSSFFFRSYIKKPKKID